MESDIDKRLVTLPIIYALKNASIEDKGYLNKAAIELKKIKSTEIVNTILMFINRKEVEEVEKCLI